MRTVTVTRTMDAQPGEVRGALEEIEPFVQAAGFDEVEVDGAEVRVSNSVGIAEIGLVLEVVEDPDADLTVEQLEGIFETMTTTYRVEPADEGTSVTARTEFALDVAVVGDVLDATVIRRQRRSELDAQLDWLERMATAQPA